jgi:hypothetical protein
MRVPEAAKTPPENVAFFHANLRPHLATRFERHPCVIISMELRNGCRSTIDCLHIWICASICSEVVIDQVKESFLIMPYLADCLLLTVASDDPNNGIVKPNQS